MPKRDLAKENRLRRSVAKVVKEITRKAAENLERMVTPGTDEAECPWSERKNIHVASMELIRLRAAEQRAKQESQNATLLGVVMVPARMQDPGEWEQFAAQKANAIEVKANDRVLTEIVQRPPGDVGEVPGQLRAGVREENQKGAENGEEEKGQREGLLSPDGGRAA